MMINPFLNSARQLRNGWWILIFFLVLATILVPILLLAQNNVMDVTISLQAVILIVVSWLCQALYRKPLAELTGKVNSRWYKDFCIGGLVGSALMLIPAVILGICGWVDWQWNPVGLSFLS
jgi:hypothetical protein